ncbi:MAG: PIN domain-containing protein [candidate division NC10 bacterium]|nr:PIN domain-containing protein [candidate division NC10 bacterium]MDE2321804.1 PIN domain-containing protein [candidate division NC10 bacterium]
MSDVLVDTSVWLEFFRVQDSPYAETLDQLLEEERVCTSDLIKAEILPGARTPKQFRELKEYFDALPLATAPASLWEEIIEVQSRLKRGGVNGISIPDLMIAVVAKANSKALFTKDHDFQRIQRVLPVELLECPS